MIDIEAKILVDDIEKALKNIKKVFDEFPELENIE